MFKIKALRSRVKFDKKIAKRFSKTTYQEAQSKDRKQYEHIQNVKIKLSTPKWEVITNLISYYKNLGVSQPSSTGKILLGLYHANLAAIKSGVIKKNTKLMSIVAKPETLLLAYQEIKGNRGAMTKAAEVSKETYNNYTEAQKELYTSSHTLPDEIDLYKILAISQLLREGKYPWGASLRISIDKPGQPDKKRPLTIPPFMDRIVQKAIDLVLVSIYEPAFEITNRSFGFRPNKGTIDALAAITDKGYANGMRTAVEGDISAAYDTVNREKLLTILSKRIKDRKFLDMIKTRLDYVYKDAKKKGLTSTTIGIPQGGIDSPYLFNIYMNELDDFVQTKLQAYIEGLNIKNTSTRYFNKRFNSIKAERKKLLRHLKKAKENLRKNPTEKENLYNKIKSIRLNNHKKNKSSSSPSNRRLLRILYIRYADDWILLTNGNKEVGNTLKLMISDFLEKELALKLSEEKTLVTNITKEPARFLGFEIRCADRGPLYRRSVIGEKFRKHTTLKKSGLLTWAKPDKQRLIDRLHMKGFCSPTGFPISVPWLSTLEASTIVERFNSVIRGLGEYYLPCIRNKSQLHRWIYILRYSCLKTLAQKYNTSIKKIFKRFGDDMYSKGSQTISVKVNLKIRKKLYEKTWKLITYRDLLSKVHNERFKQAVREFWDRDRGYVGNYPLSKGATPKVTNLDFLEKISWVSWRTIALFDLPCAYCGSDRKVHQHHLNHIRKRAFSLIPTDQTFKQVMALRNRKQIPLCETCHLRLVHPGKYNGLKLINLAPQSKLLDNRIVHIESFVKPGIEYEAKSLEEKGWTLISVDQDRGRAR